jgi:2'-5' RNA ligase
LVYQSSGKNEKLIEQNISTMDQLSLFNELPKKASKIVYEYFFLISPDQPVKNAVRYLKKRLNAEVHIDNADLHSVPHISLFKTRTVDPNFSIDPFAAALSKVHAFEITINGLGAFEQYNRKKTFYLKLKEQDIISSIFYTLRECRGDYSRPDFTSHLTIARNITEGQLSWIQNLNDYNLKGEFFCSSITVLKRQLNPNDSPKSRFEVYDEIHLLKRTNSFFGA